MTDLAPVEVVIMLPGQLLGPGHIVQGSKAGGLGQVKAL